MMERTGPGRENSKMRWAGSGRGRASRNSIGRAATHRLKTFKWMSRAGSRRIISKIDGAGRAAAREMWAPYMTLSKAHEAAHAF